MIAPLPPLALAATLVLSEPRSPASPPLAPLDQPPPPVADEPPPEVDGALVLSLDLTDV